ncbi:hypothetical protein DFJ58DRAFT_813094 [Suillus subalutaceus]|uniref:uncharacterized protein n=1 Tax=Suillus subalutaceus TaxID=48586 RepID=UPI001B866E52|nr:uncharacterized protein DFJ58DRAFT_813094 [Suillus subalutaceus]KAG1839017.1 hypothetical protein DFJ58DRAFT_813094 [Suillus subalutaceus]
MAFSLKNYLLYSPYFCFCIPVRFGFVLLTCLSFLFSGVLSVLVWFELSHSYSLTNKEKISFWAVGIIETILLAVSVIGFIGAVARKQRFVAIYAYFVYIHLLLNVIVGIYFLVTIRQSNRQQLVDECYAVLTNNPSESNCQSLMNVSTYVFIAVVSLVLLLELYGALIATRYLNTLAKQKKVEHSRRLGLYHSVANIRPSHSRDPSGMSDDIELLHHRDSSGTTFSSLGGAYDYGDDVLDITHPPTSNELVPTHHPDMLSHNQRPSQSSSTPTHRQQPSHSSAYPSSSTSSPPRSFRALPPRPSSSVVAEIPATSISPQVSDQTPRTTTISDPPSSFSYESRDPSTHPNDDFDRRSTYSVSTNAHAALMEHASLMLPRFFPPSNVPPVPELPPYSQSGG